MENAGKVIEFFKEFSSIPHASYDEKRASDYLVRFAETRGLPVSRDSYNNVLIKKPATVTDCKCAPVIIQGHMDMVYVREPGCDCEYEDGISVVEKNGWLCAEGTTLGADNGIAVAYALALLDSKDVPHPDLEVVLTVQEEVGLVGAENFDCTKLKGKYLINLDTEDEGVFYTSCAGALRNDLEIPIERELITGKTELKVGLGDMLGGHSGIEINLGRGNAIILMARLLADLDKTGVYLSALSCDGKMNAIASRCEAVLYLEPELLDSVLEKLSALVAKFNHELKGVDSVELKTEMGEREELYCYTRESMERVVNTLLLMPNGVLGMSSAVPGLVETSANPGVLTQTEDILVVSSSIRSCVGTRKASVARQMTALAALCGGRMIFSNDYPQWEYRKDSPLRELAMASFRELSGLEPKTEAIHAGLECGYFDMKIPGVDIISFGPDQQDVHTPKERASISSIENVWRLILRLLEKLAKQ